MFLALSLEIKEVTDNLDLFFAYGPLTNLKYASSPMLTLATKYNLAKVMQDLDIYKLFFPHFERDG